MASYLQGAFAAPGGGTIRVTYDPGGSPSTSDWVILDDDYWASTDAMIAEWNAQLESDLGSGAVVVDISVNTNAHTGTVRVTTDGPNFSIDFQHAGTTRDVGTWLGSSSNITNQASGTAFSGAHRAGWYPKYELQAIRRTGQREHRSRTLLQSGTMETGHNRSPSDELGGPVQLRLRFHDGTGNMEGHSQLFTFIDDIHDGDAGGVPVFTATWGAASEYTETVRLVEPNLEVMPRQPAGTRPLELWDLELDCEVSS